MKTSISKEQLQSFHVLRSQASVSQQKKSKPFFKNVEEKITTQSLQGPAEDDDLVNVEVSRDEISRNI